MIGKIKSLFSRDNFENIFLFFNRSNIKDKSPVLNFPDKPSVFIAVKNVNWEKAGLVDSWKSVCPYVHWDWGNEYDQYAHDWVVIGKRNFNNELLERVFKAKEEQGINIFFSYLSGRWVYPETIMKIRENGIITINLGFDDRHSFWGTNEMGEWSGNSKIASSFNLNLTLQSPKDVKKYHKVSAKAIYLRPGGNEKVFYPVHDIEKNIDVSFIGQPYGIRKKIIHYLVRNSIHFQGFGKGWSSGSISSSEMVEIYSRSWVTLGFGFVGRSKIRTGLKGRDFEIPLTGTAYITTYNNDLAECFKEDEEILFYRNKKDLLNKIEYYHNRPELLKLIGQKGRERALKEHLWSSRWKQILEI